MQRKSVVLTAVLLFVLHPRVPAQETVVAIIAVNPPATAEIQRDISQDPLIAATFDRIVALADDKNFLMASFPRRAAWVRSEVERYAVLALAKSSEQQVQPGDVRRAFGQLGPAAKQYLVHSGVANDETAALMKLNTHFSLYFFWEMYNGREKPEDGLMVRN